MPIMAIAHSSRARKKSRSSLGWALAMSSAPLVDIGLTSTTEELMAMAVTTPIGLSSGSAAIGVTIGLITPRVPVVEAKAETMPTT